MSECITLYIVKCRDVTHINTYRDIYSGHFPHPLLKNREEFEGGLEKRKGKGGGERRKKKRVIKQTLKYLYEA